MKALVTGATGFIGAEIVRKLAARGDSVRALVLPGEDRSRVASWISEFVEGDITRPETLSGVADEADTVFHLAARVLDYGSREAFYKPIFEGTKNMLAACKGKAGRFVHASSIAACGLGEHLKGRKEEDPVKKSGIPYNDAKADAEALVRATQKDFARGCVIIRPSNVIGPGSVWVTEVLGQIRKNMMLFFDQGRYSASLVHVANLADAFLLAADREEASGRTYFVRDDWDATWKRYITDIAAMAGKPAPKGSIPFKAGWIIGAALEAVCTPLGIRPPATRLAAAVMGRDNDVANARAKAELGWKTTVGYEQAMEEIRSWLQATGRIPGH
ncbi:MAG: NAD-dependent epimerase/dehydratase family protein [Thermodesulfobacteriota bacterium]